MKRSDSDNLLMRRIGVDSLSMKSMEFDNLLMRRIGFENVL